MPTAEEQTWAGSATGRKPGAKAEETSWTSILAPGNRGDGRTSWVSERGKGAEPAVDDDEFEVESAMLAPLAELQDRKLTGGWSSGGRWRAAARRKRNAAFVMGAGFVVVVFLIVGGTTNSRWAKADSLCQTLDRDTTGSNDVTDWVPWAETLSQVYLTHRAPAVPEHTPEEDAEECAKSGWKAGCTRKVFHKPNQDEHELAIIEADRRALEDAYRVAVSKVLPVEQELRLPAGIALSYKRAVAEAQKGVCEIAPKDPKCIAARTVEVRAISALQAALVREVKPRAFGAGLDPKGAEMHTLRTLARLIHEQDPVDTVTQNAWRNFNAITAVVLRQTLQHVQERASGYQDMMLYPHSSNMLYLGRFQDLQFEGHGTLYYTNGKVAYTGGWKAGRMHGEGTLLHQDGSLVWEGSFDMGRPSQPWYSF